MNLATERDALVEVLEQIGTAAPYLPERLNPPVWILTPADPYVTPGQTFKSVRVHFDLTFIAAVKTAAATAQDMDRAVADAIGVLVGQGYSVENVKAPFVLSANNAQFPAVTITASTATRL